jgi:hypothetical protein
MYQTIMKQVKIGDTLYLPDAKEGTNKMHKMIKMSTKEVFGDGGKQILAANFPVFAPTKTWKKTK